MQKNDFSASCKEARKYSGVFLGIKALRSALLTLYNQFAVSLIVISANIVPIIEANAQNGIACPSSESIMLVSDSKGTFVFTVDGRKYPTSCYEVIGSEGIAVNAFGDRVYIASASGEIGVFSYQTRTLLFKINTATALGAGAAALDVDLSEDGRFLYVGTYEGLAKYDALTGALLDVLVPAAKDVWGISIAPNGTIYYTAGWTTGSGSLYKTDANLTAATLVVASTVRGNGSFFGITHDTDGTIWAARFNNTNNVVEHLDANGNLIKACNIPYAPGTPAMDHVWDIAIGPEPDNDIFLASGDGKACVYRVDRETCQYSVVVGPVPGSASKGIAFACADAACVDCATTLKVTSTSSCNRTTNTYSVTGTLSFVNAVGGTAIITDGIATTSVPIKAAPGSSQVSFTLNGLYAGSGSHTISVKLPGCDPDNVTYTAPPSCICPPSTCYTTKVQKM